MPSDLHVTALGSVVAVSVAPEARSRLRDQWSRCLATEDSPPVTRIETGASQDPHQQDYALASALTRAGIAQLAGHYMMFHACGIADPDTGRAAVLVAPSGTGKTTAAARLCAVGFGYISDETVAFDHHREILPYPKPLSIALTDRPGHKSQHGPDELGLLPCPDHPHARLLVLLERDGGRAGTPYLESVPLLEAAVALTPHTSALPAMPTPLRTLCDHIDALGGAQRLHYRDIEDAAELLRAALADAEAVDSGAEHLPFGGDDAPPGDGADETPILPDAVVCRGPYSDAVAHDGEVLVLIGNVPMLLQGLGATIWRRAAEHPTVADLQRACVAEHGDHPQAFDLVRDAVQTLWAHRVLRRPA